MAHWRTMVKSDYFCSADLWDEIAGEYKKLAVKIVKVVQGEVVGEKGRKKGLPFLHLEDKAGKPMRAPFGANPTNCTTIGSVLGTPDVKRWPGQWIGLYVTKVDGPHGMVDAIRVHPKPIDVSGGKDSAKPSDAPSGEPTEDEKRAIAERERKEAGG
jgi:hypothetical protein